MASPDQLAVWMNGTRVGVWSRRRGGAMRFQYDTDWVASEAGRVLSLSLPFTPGNEPHRGEVVNDFFDNLLPDSVAIRERIRMRFGTASTGAFDLLGAVGRDCVGAVQLLPEGESPRGYDRIEAELLDESGVERAIDAALSGGRGIGQTDAADEFRISIAGAQEKTALLFYRNRWRRPLGATPTTHILKLPLGVVGNLMTDMQDSVENEWLCARIMAGFGLSAAHCEIDTFGARKVLVVERFDRAMQAGRWIARLPQEDFCQALGRPARLKYESDGGPGMADVLRVLAGSSHAREDSRAFIKAQIVFWLLAATDGHAKNFSLFHERGGTYRLTPFYDVLSAWPVMGNSPHKLPWQKVRLAMAVRSKNAHWKIKDILPRHWDAVAQRAGLGDARALITEVVEQAPAAVEQAGRDLPANFPARVADSIFAGINEQLGRLKGEH